MTLVVTRDEMRPYWVVALITLEAPIPVEAEAQGAIGYYRDFGVTAVNEAEARDLVETEVIDGYINWEKTSISSVIPGRLPKEVRKRCSDSERRGLWYRSGRIFFQEEG